ncbi:MAG: response regulator, partial [Actinomycetota bacterium]|nr:response regulator [Actinomycetota bacterium]
MSPSDVPILVVDDDDVLRRSTVRILERDGHTVTEAACVEDARAALASKQFPIVLLDVSMPGESGLVLLEELAAASPDVACIMVTGADSRDLGESALAHGAYGYVIKPFTANEILITVSNGIRRRRLELEQRGEQERLEAAVADRTRELWNSTLQLERREDQLRLANEETVRRLALAAEFRDADTARHVTRVGEYASVVARRIGFDDEGVRKLELAAELHDVGKIGVPDEILRKRGGLSPEERETMRTHTTIGYMILAGAGIGLLDAAANVALTHHEWWDGSGYPNGLAGEDIPLEGRITAIADVFDALVSTRVYRKAYALVEAVQML